MAQRALVGEADYEAFETLNAEVHKLGMRAEDQLISDVARAFHRIRK
jgi:hypothetical protein